MNFIRTKRYIKAIKNPIETIKKVLFRMSDFFKKYTADTTSEPICGMGRENKILHSIDKNKKGLEIGPSHRPIAPKKDGYNVKIVDHMDRDGLRQKYRNHGIDIDAIEDVDFVWSGQKLSELITEKFDWIIASHVIEHTPDLVGFLSECELLLNDVGVLSLAVPDKRYCFDHFRELTSLARVIDSIGNKIHTKGSVAEYYLKVVKKNGHIAWDRDMDGLFENVHCVGDAIEGMKKVSNGEYIDVHSWVFTPDSFRDIIADLKNLGFINLIEEEFFDTVGHEFFVSLKKPRSLGE